MGTGYKPLPIGVDDFEKLITKGYYYVDKTWLIKELLDMKGEANLFTRPRRFGKTLNLSTLRCFFERVGEEESRRHLYAGLKIMGAGDAYTSHQGRYPVIMLTLKSAKQETYALAYRCLREAVANEFVRHNEVLPSLATDVKKEKFCRLRDELADEGEYRTALAFLSECLYRHYGEKAIILIDEYDVPLENAYYAGFYDEMIAFIRSLFESALKTNPNLEFAVITGCLRISRESIFTGLNNLEIVSVLDANYSEYFGFTSSEVNELLQFYGQGARMDKVREWYDGYRFGSTEVYNPWSVLNYTKALYTNSNALPSPYWSNTSSNTIVRDLIKRSDTAVKDEIETLIAGGTIVKPVHEDITYRDIYQSKDNLWNFLFFTGYLKQINRWMEGNSQMVEMAIPNAEVAYIYENMIRNWFREVISVRDLSVLYQAMLHGDAAVFQEELSKLLRESISYMDSREEFYHGFLLGVMGNIHEYLVKSNREAGDGRYDICVRSLDVSQAPVILELKVSDTFKGMEGSSRQALRQIRDRHYDDVLPAEGYTEVLNYGIAFFRKQCRIEVERKDLM
ncbi:MAG: AAA family ATPase [Enterocloster citroniae]|nr:AAA family ATPase [Enterocloster citroniae]